MSDIALIVQGDALRLPLADASVDLVVTSPPFAFLRAYDTGYPHLEVGTEATPAEFLEHLWQATAEMVRVLKPTGSIFVDLGDKYDSGSHHMNGISSNADPAPWGKAAEATNNIRRRPVMGRPKSLMLLPERYRVGCVDQLGLIARAVIVWDKANSLPESIRDRVRRNHEDWVHLVKQPRYYSAVDEIREPYSPGSAERVRQGFRDKQVLNGIGAGQRRSDELAEGYEVNPLGKLPGSVWRLPSEPLRLPDHLGVQHYAAMPSEWPRRLILGWSPPGICLDCGQGRFPVVERSRLSEEGERLLAQRGNHASQQYMANSGRKDAGWGLSKNISGPERERLTEPATILGYACACTPHTNHPGSGEPSGPTYADSIATTGYPDTGTNDNGRDHTSLQNRPKVGPWREYHLDGWRPPPTRPAVVLDPFSGTGTTPMVARALSRIGIGVDLSMPYCRAARWRIHHDAGKAISRTWAERQGSLL